MLKFVIRWKTSYLKCLKTFSKDHPDHFNSFRTHKCFQMHWNLTKRKTKKHFQLSMMQAISIHSTLSGVPQSTLLSVYTASLINKRQIWKSTTLSTLEPLNYPRLWHITIIDFMILSWNSIFSSEQKNDVKQHKKNVNGSYSKLLTKGANNEINLLFKSHVTYDII